MKSIRVAVGVFVLMAVSAYAARAAQGIKEGRWSMSMTVQGEGMGDEAADAMKEMEEMSPEDRAMMQQMMKGMNIGMSSQGTGMTITNSQCITNDNPVPKGKDQSDCEETHTTKGNTVSFEIVCPDSTSTGKVTYQNDSMNGTIKSTTTEGKKQVNTTMKISGRYEGPCTQAAD